LTWDILFGIIVIAETQGTQKTLNEAP